MNDPRRLELPNDVVQDQNAFELAAVWVSNERLKIMIGCGTGLEERPHMWGEILAGVAVNAALSIQQSTGASIGSTLASIVEGFETSLAERQQGTWEQRPDGPG